MYKEKDGQNGDSGRTRTPNLLIRSQLLYPVELRNHFDNASGCAGFYPICPEAFSNDARLTQSKLLPKMNPKQSSKNMYFDYDCENGFGLCWRSMSPGTIAGEGKIISIGARLDAP